MLPQYNMTNYSQHYQSCVDCWRCTVPFVKSKVHSRARSSRSHSRNACSTIHFRISCLALRRLSNPRVTYMHSVCTSQKTPWAALYLCDWPRNLITFYWYKCDAGCHFLTALRHIPMYTRCPRRNGQNFGRVFLVLKYTDITQNTYVQSWTVTEIKAREKCGLLAVPRSVPGSRDVIPIRCALSVLVNSRLSAFLAATAHVKCLVTLRTTMTWVRVFL